MLSAVALDHQLGFETGEVGDIVAKRNLPAEFQLAQPPPPQKAP
jgi:hypothetical protein